MPDSPPLYYGYVALLVHVDVIFYCHHALARMKSLYSAQGCELLSKHFVFISQLFILSFRFLSSFSINFTVLLCPFKFFVHFRKNFYIFAASAVTSSGVNPVQSAAFSIGSPVFRILIAISCFSFFAFLSALLSAFLSAFLTAFSLSFV